MSNKFGIVYLKTSAKLAQAAAPQVFQIVGGSGRTVIILGY